MKAVAPGYSGTPLAKKLGIAANARVFAKNAPANYLRLLQPIPPGVAFDTKIRKSTDVIHVFVDRKAALIKEFGRLRSCIRPDCAISVVAEEISEGSDRHHGGHDPRGWSAARLR
jgi:hypothetical protein